MRAPGCQAGTARHVASQRRARHGMVAGTPIAAGDSTRNDRGRVAGRPRQAHSCVGLNDLAGLRLPVGEEIADIDVGFQLGLLVVSQIAFIGADIEFGDPNGIVLRKIERQDALGESRSHSVSWQIEHPPENIREGFGAKRRRGHPESSVRCGDIIWESIRSATRRLYAHVGTVEGVWD